MSITKVKHAVAEIDGVRCKIIETGIDESRCNFMKGLLEVNKFEVKVKAEEKKEENAPTTFTIGVTDLVFNPVIAIYEKKLRTKEGHFVTPAYWNNQEVVEGLSYWEYREKAHLTDKLLFPWSFRSV
ncbi:MAG: hypothetical protein HXX09_02290 [Bacteroidetes bacterium]|nr:hypothetical protein [Bacteroidota bacterium]